MEKFKNYIEAFLAQNAKINLISKNDEKLLWEKHIFDSIQLDLFLNKYEHGFKMLDIGTGGGFPAVPIAFLHPELQVFALDSIRKKIMAVGAIKTALELDNLHPVCDRVENIKEKYDIVTSRAVASLDKLLKLALPRVKQGGYFVAYKSQKVQEEIDASKNVLKKYQAEIVDTIEYALPLEEVHIRNLVVIKR